MAITSHEADQGEPKVIELWQLAKNNIKKYLCTLSRGAKEVVHPFARGPYWPYGRPAQCDERLGCDPCGVIRLGPHSVYLVSSFSRWVKKHDIKPSGPMLD